MFIDCDADDAGGCSGGAQYGAAVAAVAAEPRLC